MLIDLTEKTNQKVLVDTTHIVSILKMPRTTKKKVLDNEIDVPVWDVVIITDVREFVLPNTFEDEDKANEYFAWLKLQVERRK